MFKSQLYASNHTCFHNSCWTLEEKDNTHVKFFPEIPQTNYEIAIVYVVQVLYFCNM